MEIGTGDVLGTQFSTRRFQTSESNRSELGQEDFSATDCCADSEPRSVRASGKRRIHWSASTIWYR